jgi:uncharacterized protein (TIGR02266 family)
MFGLKKRGDHLQIELLLNESSEHNFWCGMSWDIEQGGVFIATHQPIRIGTVVELLVLLPDRPEPTTMSGVVRWTRQYVEGSDVPAGIGVKFGALDGPIRDAVHHFTDSIRPPILFDLEEVPIRQRSKLSH